eukprot:TRINITY_DN57141_c0_g1_i1.p1 TRINITY_DN57141_c0_g1~~TRINITY_DN57141_c0_g1_i1.p1  ORF type:complete len:326 (-),score=29.66 TRINITY_DN57141_c0_g1_i1:27-947(-)
MLDRFFILTTITAVALASGAFIGSGATEGGGVNGSEAWVASGGIERIFWTPCADGGKSPVEGCGSLCVMQSTRNPQFVGVSLKSSVAGTVYATKGHDAGIKVIVDAAGQNYLDTYVDSDGVFHIGWNYDKVIADPRQACIIQGAVVVEMRLEGASLSSINLAPSSAFHAQTLNNLRAIGLSSSSGLEVTQLTGDDLEIVTASSSSVTALMGKYNSVRVHQASGSTVNFGKMRTTDAFVVLAPGAAFTGMTSSGTLSVDIASSASMITSASPGLRITGACASGSSLTVNGGSLKNVVGACDGTASRA